MRKRKTPKKKDIEKKESEKLVAIYFKNGIGNFIMLTPAIQALCAMHDAKADIVLGDKWEDSRKVGVRELAEYWPLVNSVYEFDRETFDRDRYEQLFYSRHGEKSDGFNYFEKHSGYDGEHVNWRAEKLNEVEFYMQDVFNLGYRGPVPGPYCHMGRTSIFTKNPNVFNKEVLKIGFCNGFFAGSRWKWERKGWPHYEELVRLLNRFFGEGSFQILLFGKGEKEKEWARGVREMGNNVVDYVNALEILQTAQLMRTCHLFITTDTGLMHVADALGIPMIVLFGPTLVSKNGPWNREHRIAKSPARCAPCQQSPYFYNCEEWKCMEALSASMVMVEVREYVADLVKRGKINPGLSAINRTDYVKWTCTGSGSLDKRIQSKSFNDDLYREDKNKNTMGGS